MSIKIKCRNMTRAKQFIGDIIHSYNVGDIVDNEYMLELVEYHPTKDIKLENLEWLKIKIHPYYKKPALYFKNKNDTEDDDLSWILCIRNLYGKYNADANNEANIKQAFRNELQGGCKTQYYYENTTRSNGVATGICAECGDHMSNIHVDHFENPFKNILDSFLNDNNINMNDVCVYETTKRQIRLKCEDTAAKWLEYHDSIAIYRILCGTCNVRNGSYGF